jgi:hypothetical protein
MKGLIFGMRFVLKRADLEESVLLVYLEFVGTKELETAKSLFFSETFLVALEELEDVVDDDGF